MTELQIDAYFDFTFPVQTPATGACVDADALPTYRVYASGSDTAVATGNCAKRDDANTLGYYTARAQVTVAAGFAVGTDYEVRAAAIVGGVTGAAVVGGFRVVPADVVRDDVFTDTRGAKLDNLDTTVGSRSTLTAQQVWEYGTRTLTAISSSLFLWLAQVVRDALKLAPSTGAPVAGSIDAKLDDITSTATEARLAELDPANLPTTTDNIKTKTDTIPASPAAVGSAMTLTAGERTAISAAVLAATVTFPDASTMTVEEILEEVWANNAGDWSLSGLNWTIRWPDASTPAMVFAVDDPDSPTSRVRA